MSPVAIPGNCSLNEVFIFIKSKFYVGKVTGFAVFFLFWQPRI